MLVSISQAIKRDLSLAPKARIHFIAWGTAPGFSESDASALKARLTLWRVLNRAFSAFHAGQSITWGDAPG
jgi:hypothetical protein